MRKLRGAEEGKRKTGAVEGQRLRAALDGTQEWVRGSGGAV